MIEIIEDCDETFLNNNKGYCKWLIRLSEVVLKRLNRQFDKIEKIVCDNHDVTIYYSIYCHENIQHCSVTVPYKYYFRTIALTQSEE